MNSESYVDKSMLIGWVSNMDEESMSAGKTFNVDQAVFFSLTSDRPGEQFSTGLLSL